MKGRVQERVKGPCRTRRMASLRAGGRAFKMSPGGWVRSSGKPLTRSDLAILRRLGLIG